MRPLTNVLVSLVALSLSGSVFADNRSIQGTVIGADGKPVSGAEVRVERTDAKSPPAFARTDAKGRYALKDLPPGAYSVTALIKGVPRSRASITTQADRWIEVDFDLRLAATDGKGTKPTSSSSDALQRNDVNRMQQSLGGNINSMSFPGH